MESTGYGRQDTPQLRMPSSNASPMILSTRVRELSQTVHPAHVTKDDACVSCACCPRYQTGALRSGAAHALISARDARHSPWSWAEPPAATELTRAQGFVL